MNSVTDHWGVLKFRLLHALILALDLEDCTRRREFVAGLGVAVTQGVTDTQLNLCVRWELFHCLAPVASAIVHNMTSSTRLIDELPAAAIEAMLSYSREQHRQDNPRDELGHAYKEVRAALLKYAEVALRNARMRERRLFYGITGIPPEGEGVIGAEP